MKYSISCHHSSNSPNSCVFCVAQADKLTVVYATLLQLQDYSVGVHAREVGVGVKLCKGVGAQVREKSERQGWVCKVVVVDAARG